jgi:hypothetical protein
MGCVNLSVVYSGLRNRRAVGSLFDVTIRMCGGLRGAMGDDRATAMRGSPHCFLNRG